MNELSREIGLSVGLVHKVIKQLEYDGLVTVKGLRTGKVFFLKSANKLLANWVSAYNLLKKTKTRGFYSPHSIDPKEAKKNGLIPALHLATSEYFNVKSTNLNSKEFYLLNWESLPKITDQFSLQELDRGYELLLVKPYYSSLLAKISDSQKNSVTNNTWKKAYGLLVMLDLCHFPLRGSEQAETLYRKLPYLNSIAPWKEIESAIR